MSGPSAHHELGASGAYRWLKCPGSVAAQRGSVDESSVYAREGTSAHELAEASLLFWKKTEGSSRAIMGWRAQAETEGFDTKEMIFETEKYLDYVKDLCGGDPGALEVEQRVAFGSVIPGGFGTADAVVVSRDSGGNIQRIDVADLKYGKGKRVDAAGNPQLRLYAYGAVLGLIDAGFLDEDLDDFDTILVRGHIGQPRLEHFDAETLSVSGLIAWAETEVAPVVAAINAGDETRVAGSHCDFCNAQATCRAKAEQHAADLHTDWDDFVETGPGSPNADGLTAEEVGKLLAHKKAVEKWFEALKAYAYTEIKNGREIPGWKLVAGNRVQTWTVGEPELLEAFKSQRALKQDEYAPRKLLSPAQASKLLPEKSKLRDLIYKKPGSAVLADAKSKKPAIEFKPVEDEFDDPAEDI